MTDITITGDTLWNGSWLLADTLTFIPGAKLEFSRKAINDGGGHLVIMARKVVCDQQNPGTITWEKCSFTPNPVPPRIDGQSFDPHHGGTGACGGNGSDGSTGIFGEAGENAPFLEFWVLEIPEIGPIIDFRGQYGEDGGPGGDGGNGGNGSKGTKAVCGIFDCRRGGGWGGCGGNGGNGGDGGNGGKGGTGGKVYIFAPNERLANLTAKSRCLITGGSGGNGGSGGKRGIGGIGGDGGDGQRPWCSDETSHCRSRDAIEGDHDGGNGKNGLDGPEGASIGVPVTLELFENRLKGR